MRNDVAPTARAAGFRYILKSWPVSTMIGIIVPPVSVLTLVYPQGAPRRATDYSAWRFGFAVQPRSLADGLFLAEMRNELRRSGRVTGNPDGALVAGVPATDA